jgi:hypothetical protein
MDNATLTIKPPAVSDTPFYGFSPQPGPGAIYPTNTKETIERDTVKIISPVNESAPPDLQN